MPLRPATRGSGSSRRRRGPASARTARSRAAQRGRRRRGLRHAPASARPQVPTPTISSRAASPWRREPGERADASWWPFSQTSRPTDSTRWSPSAGGAACAAGCEALDVDARRADLDSLRRTPSSSERVGRPSVVGRNRSGGREHAAPVAARTDVAVGADERQRLPDREHEPEAEPRLEPCRLEREPVADLGRVDDVGAAQRPLEPEVALADRPGQQRAGPAAGQPAESCRCRRCRSATPQCRSRCGPAPRRRRRRARRALPGAQLPWVRWRRPRGSSRARLISAAGRARTTDRRGTPSSARASGDRARRRAPAGMRRPTSCQPAAATAASMSRRVNQRRCVVSRCPHSV